MIWGCSGRCELARLLSLLFFVVVWFENGFQRVGGEVALADEPLVVLFDDEAGGEPEQGTVVGAPLCQVECVLVGEECAVDDVGQVSFQAAAGFGGALPFRGLAVEVSAGGWIPAGLDHRDRVEGTVELAVATPGEGGGGGAGPGKKARGGGPGGPQRPGGAGAGG